MPDPISLAEVQRAQAQGAKISFPPKRVEVDELGSVVAELKRIADSGNDDTSNALKAITEAIGGIKLQAPAMDIQPFVDSLRFLAESLAPKPCPPPKYTFTVQRNNRGQIDTVVAEPDNG